MTDEPNPCQCGCEDVWCVVDCGLWAVECDGCGRHTGPYYDRDNAVRAWNCGHDVRELQGVKVCPGDYNYNKLSGVF